MVKALVKLPEEILAALTPTMVDLLHAALGIATEGGEILDAVKAHVIYGKPIDAENILEELGDIEFFLQQFRTNRGLTREQALHHNVKKLAKRYKGSQYSDQAAIVREDKKITGETDNKVL